MITITLFVMLAPSFFSTEPALRRLKRGRFLWRWCLVTQLRIFCFEALTLHPVILVPLSLVSVLQPLPNERGSASSLHSSSGGLIFVVVPIVLLKPSLYLRSNPSSLVGDGLSENPVDSGLRGRLYWPMSVHLKVRKLIGA